MKTPQKTTDIQEAFKILKTLIGSDKKCGKFLGIAGPHFEALRNGRVHMPARTASYIILRAREALESQKDPS